MSSAARSTAALFETRMLVIVAVSSGIAGATLLGALNRINDGPAIETNVGILAAAVMAAALCMGACLELIRRGWFGTPAGQSVLQRTGRLLLRAFWMSLVAAYLLVVGAVGWRIVRHLAIG